VYVDESSARRAVTMGSIARTEVREKQKRLRLTGNWLESVSLHCPRVMSSPAGDLINE
jgi:hypothetical protein